MRAARGRARASHALVQRRGLVEGLQVLAVADEPREQVGRAVGVREGRDASRRMRSPASTSSAHPAREGRLAVPDAYGTSCWAVRVGSVIAWG